MASERRFAKLKLRLKLPMTKARLLHLRNRCKGTGLNPANLIVQMLDSDFAECTRLRLRIEPTPLVEAEADAQGTPLHRRDLRRTRAKLTPEQVQIVFHLRDSGELHIPALAKRFGVGVSTIRRITDGRRKLVRVPGSGAPRPNSNNFLFAGAAR
jgi:hypothetical protein